MLVLSFASSRFTLCPCYNRSSSSSNTRAEWIHQSIYTQTKDPNVYAIRGTVQSWQTVFITAMMRLYITSIYYEVLRIRFWTAPYKNAFVCTSLRFQTNSVSVHFSYNFGSEIVYLVKIHSKVVFYSTISPNLYLTKRFVYFFFFVYSFVY